MFNEQLTGLMKEGGSPTGYSDLSIQSWGVAPSCSVLALQANYIILRGCKARRQCLGHFFMNISNINVKVATRKTNVCIETFFRMFRIFTLRSQTSYKGEMRNCL